MLLNRTRYIQERRCRGYVYGDAGKWIGENIDAMSIQYLKQGADVLLQAMGPVLL